MNYPVLYKANETDFSTLGLGALTSEIETLLTEERNGQFYLEMEYPVNGLHFKELKLDRIIKAKANPKLDNQRFKIIRITKPAKGVVTVYAEHVSNHTADLQLKPDMSYSGNAQQALNTWKNNIVGDHPFTVYSDITTTGSGKWETKEVENARRALGGMQGSILDTYGGEYAFDNYHIRLLRNRGNDNGTPIMYGKNLIDLEQEEEIASTYTSIMPHASYLPEDADDHVEITLPEYFVDSEYVDNYARRKILKVDFTADEITTVEELRARAKRYIKDNNVGVPNVNLRVKFIDLAKTLDYKDKARVENIGLCDWVPVYFDELGINQKAKVIKVVFNRTLDRYEELEIGEARASLSQSIDSVVDGKIEDVRNEVNIVRTAANGKNKNHWGETEPTQGMSEGDTWFKQIGDGEEEIHRYVNGQWKFILSTADTTKNARDIEDALRELDDVRTTANEANQEINDAVANYGGTSLDDVISNIDVISNRADSNAQTAMDDALSALSGVSGLQSDVSRIDVDINDLEGSLSLKADNTRVDAINSIVNQHGLDIQANADELRVKADSSTVDTISGQVSTLQSDFSVMSGEISSKVSQAELSGAIDGIEVGGRNLFIYSQRNVVNHGRGTLNFSRDDTPYGFYMVGDKNDLDDIRMYDVLDGNGFYTVSFDLKGSQNGVGSTGVNINGSNATRFRTRVDNEWERVSVTFEVTNYDYDNPSDNYIGFDPGWQYIWHRYVQVEKGNKATDWTPAPEDTDAKFDYIETEWTQTFDTFSQTVAGIDGRVTSQKQTIDTISSTVSGHGNRISTVEQTAEGLQTTVADKANQTQVTQLADAISTKVSANEVSEAILNSKEVLDTRRTINDPPSYYVTNYPSTDVKEFKNLSSIGLNGQGEFGMLHTQVIYVNMYGGDVKQTVHTDTNTVYVRTGSQQLWGAWEEQAGKTYVNSQISQTNEAINLRVKKGDTLAQINIEAGNTLIQNDKIYMDASSVVFSGQAFIPGAVIENATIDNAKIADATISSAKISNLDVSKISGNTTEFVKSYWNTAVGGSVNIAGSGILTTSSDGSQISISDGRVWARNPAGSNLGQFGYIQDPNSPLTHYVRIRTSWGTNFAISQVYNGLSHFKDTLSLSINDSGQATMSVDARIQTNYEGVYFSDSTGQEHGSIRRVGSTLRIIGPQGGDSGSVAIYGRTSGSSIKSGYVFSTYNDGSSTNHMWASINMHSYSIYNQSDERLKRNIVQNEINSLEVIKQWKMAGFYWRDQDSPQDRQFGVIAQSAPEIANEDRDGYLVVSSTKQLQVTSHAVQQLAFKEAETADLAGQAYFLAETLADKMERLENRIEELEGKVA